MGLARRRDGPVCSRGDAAFTHRFERAVLDIQRRVLGLSLHTRRSWSPRRETDLVLSRPLPRGFSGRTRILLLADARTAPGYLRESVFTSYVRGRWQTPDAGVPLEPAAGSVPGEVTTRYMLTSIPDAAPLERIRFTVFAPRLLTGICLPGASVLLYCPPRGRSVRHHQRQRAYRWRARRSATRPTSALRDPWPPSPLPDGRDGAPHRFRRCRGRRTGPPSCCRRPLAPRWVSGWAPGDCRAAASPRGRLAHRGRFRRPFFTTARDARLHPQPDSLIHFMERREGYCIHFSPVPPCSC